MFIAYAQRLAKSPCRELLHTVCALLLFFMAASASHAQSKQTILILGDSISAAYGIALEEGWVNLLDQSLAQSHPQQFQVINASISGETTDGGLTRLPALLDKHQPAYVIIELGGNDGLRGFPIKRLRANLSALITQSQNSGAQVLLVGMQIPPNYGPRYTRQFQQSYTLLAAEFNTALITALLGDIAIHPELMQADGIHPVAKAQPAIRDKVLPSLLQLIKAHNTTVANSG